MIKVLVLTITLPAICSKGRQYINKNSLPFQTLESGREPARLHLQRLGHPRRAVCNKQNELQNSENKRQAWPSQQRQPRTWLSSYQHVGGTEIVLAGHALFQLLGHLLNVLNFIQQVQDMFMFNSFNPQLPKLIPFAVQQHLT